jgi:hypothetical protein
MTVPTVPDFASSQPAHDAAECKVARCKGRVGGMDYVIPAPGWLSVIVTAAPHSSQNFASGDTR